LLRGRKTSAEALTQKRHHVFGIGVVPDHRLREDEVAVDVHVEDAAGAGDDLDAGYVVLELLENLRGQTGRVRERASGNAVFDPNDGALGHCRDPTDRLSSCA
jgi:hypothetical protein